jgi:hypothetical protein
MGKCFIFIEEEMRFVNEEKVSSTMVSFAQGQNVSFSLEKRLVAQMGKMIRAVGKMIDALGNNVSFNKKHTHGSI